MASQPEHENFDIEEQLVRIRRAREESEKLSSESRKLFAEQLKFDAERLKLEQEQWRLKIDGLKMNAEINLMPKTMIFQAMIAAGALLAAGATIARIFTR